MGRREYGLRAPFGDSSLLQEIFDHYTPPDRPAYPCYSDPFTKALFIRSGSSGRTYGKSSSGRFGSYGSFYRRPYGRVRRGVSRVRYTSKSSSSFALNQKKVQYIAQQNRTVDNAPSWESAKREAPVFTFGEDGKKRNISIREASDMMGSDGVIRIILSPEDPDIDLSEMTRRFMSEIFEREVRRRVKWVAANHYNTENPHTHILISRSLPGKTEELWFSQSWIKSGRMEREFSSLLSSIQGERTLYEMREAEKRDVERIGSLGILDRAISESSEPYGDGKCVVDLKKTEKRKGRGYRDGVYKRLEWLSANTRIAERIADGIYVLDSLWKDRIRLSDTNCILSSSEIPKERAKTSRKGIALREEELTHGLG